MNSNQYTILRNTAQSIIRVYSELEYRNVYKDILQRLQFNQKNKRDTSFTKEYYDHAISLFMFLLKHQDYLIDNIDFDTAHDIIVKQINRQIDLYMDHTREQMIHSTPTTHIYILGD